MQSNCYFSLLFLSSFPMLKMACSLYNLSTTLSASLSDLYSVRDSLSFLLERVSDVGLFQGCRNLVQL
jgi:hypothetical protein